VPPTRYIPGLGVEKGGTNRIGDTICPVRPGSRPNCVGSCGGGCTNQVKMGTGKVDHPTHRCPPPDISQDWGSKKGERTESPTRFVPCALSFNKHSIDYDVSTRNDFGNKAERKRKGGNAGFFLVKIRTSRAQCQPLFWHVLALCFGTDIACHYVSLCRSLIFLLPPSVLFPSATGEST